LRSIPGVEAVALANRTLLNGSNFNNSVAVNDGPPSDDLTYFMEISPGWLDAMKIPLAQGRDFRAPDGNSSAAIVNQTFAKRYFHGENPVGRNFDEVPDDGPRIRRQIVGVVHDARYGGMREPIPPVAYLLFHSDKTTRRSGVFIVRTSGRNPLAPASVLRKEVARAQPEFRVSNILSQVEINQSLTVRERLLATLGIFFAAVALLLAGVGLYGVLDYSVLQRRREIGIRMAIGARAGDIARRITSEIFAMVLAGAVLGLALGMASARYIESLLYQVKAGDLSMLALPSMTILGAALLAAIPAVIRAIRIDPVTSLRAE